MTEHARKTAAAVMRAVDAAIAGEPSKYPILRALADHEAAITAPIKARAEATEAALNEIVKLCEYPHRGFASRQTALAIMRIAEHALAALATEAVTEVEGS